MSDTPRTDSQKYWLELHEVVEVDFARELERENAALREDKERLDWLQSATVRVDDILTYFMNSQLDLDLRAVIDAARKEQP